jgi:hypothetical protein
MAEDRAVNANVVPQSELEWRQRVAEHVRKGERGLAYVVAGQSGFIPREWVDELWASRPQQAEKAKAEAEVVQYAPMRRRRFSTEPSTAEALDTAIKAGKPKAQETTAKAPPEPEPKPRTGARFSGDVAPLFDGAGAAKLSKRAPYDNAKEFVARHCFRDGWLATYFWQDQFWQWNGRFYEVLAPEAIRDQVWAFLDFSMKNTDDGTEKFKPEPKNVSDLLDALRSGFCLKCSRRCGSTRASEQKTGSPSRMAS